jgi:hypothetical protein
LLISAEVTVAFAAVVMVSATTQAIHFMVSPESGFESALSAPRILRRLYRDAGLRPVRYARKSGRSIHHATMQRPEARVTMTR